MNETRIVRWAVVGTGGIAACLARDMKAAGNASLVAVCSRSADRAAAFARRFGDLRVFTGLAALGADPGIDAVYVASPNTAHLDHVRALLFAGKPVLCEKPLVTTTSDADSLITLSRANGVFLMEGLWSVYLPAVDHARRLLEAGAIGRIRAVRAELAFAKTFDPESRFFSPALGGGALLDLGIYPITLALSLFGQPSGVSGRWLAAPTGVDMKADLALSYDGFTAELACGFDRDGRNRFVIVGERGTLIIDTPHLAARRVFLTRNAVLARWIERSGPGIAHRALRKLAAILPGITTARHPFTGTGLQFEIEAASRAILAGRTEEARMPLDTSRAAIAIVERVLATTPYGTSGP